MELTHVVRPRSRARTRSAQAQASRDAPSSFRLRDLPQELQLRICDLVVDPRDCARLCLAWPPLGLVAMRELESYKGLTMKVAHALVAPGCCPVDEAFLRRYMRHPEATYEGAIWLNSIASSPHRLTVKPTCTQSVHRLSWLLTSCDANQPALNAITSSAVLLIINDYFQSYPGGGGGGGGQDARTGLATHFEGEPGHERMVRMEQPDGRRTLFAGAAGEERMVKGIDPDGGTTYYEGESGHERRVRMEWRGSTVHYDGARGSERMVQVVRPDGSTTDYEGDKGAERMVRSSKPDGRVILFVGPRGAERMVRVHRQNAPSGAGVVDFTGPSGAERITRMEWPDGRVSHYEGDTERLVRMEWPDGRVGLFEGEAGHERIVSLQPESGHDPAAEVRRSLSPQPMQA